MRTACSPGPHAEGEPEAIGWAQFGPISAYPRAQVIRDRYPELPDSPAPWVVTCLQVTASAADREEVAVALLEAVCAELDRRGIGAVEAYPEGVAEPWLPSPGPARIYVAGGFERVAGDDRYPVYRRELGESAAEVDWGDLLSRGRNPRTRATSGRCRCRRDLPRTTSSGSPRNRSGRTRSATTECSRRGSGAWRRPARWSSGQALALPSTSHGGWWPW